MNKLDCGFGLIGKAEVQNSLSTYTPESTVPDLWRHEADIF
jgi:hypothetical protein